MQPDHAALLSRGWTTRAELLRAAFGGKVPGIPLEEDSPRIPLVFKEMESLRSTQTLARTRYINPTIPASLLPLERLNVLFEKDLDLHIDFRPGLKESFANVVFGHEGLHVLQAEDHFIDSFLFPTVTGPASPHFGHGPELEAVLASEETPAQTAERHLCWQKKELKKDLPHLHGTPLHLLKQHEIEARLGQVIFAAARRGMWQRLPQNREELAEMLKILQPGRRLPHSKDFPMHLLGLVPQAESALGDLRKVVKNLSRAQRTLFFDQVLPVISADLFERLGDLDARAKLGLPGGIAHGRQAARRMWHEAKREAPPWTSEQWQKAAAQAEPETLGPLVSLAVELRHHAAFPAFLEAYRRSPAFDPDTLSTPVIEFSRNSLPLRHRLLLTGAACSPFRRAADLFHSQPARSTALEKSIK